MSSELIAILEKESAAEVARILAEAKSRAEQIEREAEAAAREFADRQQQRLDAERRAALAKAQSAAQVQAAALVLRAKDEAMADVFLRAEQALLRLPQDRGRYAAVLRGLIREAAANLGGRLIVEIHPDDREVAAQAVRDLGVDAEIATAEDVRGGVRVSTPDRRFVVENTLLSRIERARPVLATEVAQLLWG
jgi:V/A-type H+-transporting ATPase subunit E